MNVKKAVSGGGPGITASGSGVHPGQGKSSGVPSTECALHHLMAILLRTAPGNPFSVLCGSLTSGLKWMARGLLLSLLLLLNLNPLLNLFGTSSPRGAKSAPCTPNVRWIQP